MVSAGQLRNHTSPAAVDVYLRGDNVRKDPPPVFHERGSSFIAGCLQPQNQHAAVLAPSTPRMQWRYSPSSRSIALTSAEDSPLGSRNRYFLYAATADGV